MQLVLINRQKLIKNAMEVDRDLVALILNSIAPWHRDTALALLLQDALGRAPAN